MTGLYIGIGIALMLVVLVWLESRRMEKDYKQYLEQREADPEYQRQKAWDAKWETPSTDNGGRTGYWWSRRQHNTRR